MGLFADCGCVCDGKKQEKKLLISLMAALTFFIIASPETFRIMRSILGKWVSSPTGCPTHSGLILHTIVFLLVTWGLMNVKNEGYEPESMNNDSDLVDDVLEEELSETEPDVEDEIPVESIPLPDGVTPESQMKMEQAAMKMHQAQLDMQRAQTEMQQTQTKTDQFQMDMIPPPISTTQKTNGDPSRPGLVPTRMADVELPLPGMSEEPIGLYDSGMVFGPANIYGDTEPSSINYDAKRNALNISCSDGSKPITN